MTRDFLSITAAVLLVGRALAAAPAAAAGFGDPFGTGSLHAASPGGSVAGELAAPCSVKTGGAPLSLTEVVDLALCNNPQTRLAWANARAQAAAVGVAESAYLPTLDLNAGRSRNSVGSSGVTYNQTTGNLTAGYLLYDFGGRAASLESARQLMTALAATQDAALQGVFLGVVQAYYQSYAADAAVVAAREAERAAAESLKAAEARYRIGTGTSADRLQAQTAAAQATLTRIQAEGNARSALGTLANTMGLDAQAAPPLLPPAEAQPDAAFERDLGELIAAAKRARPDLAAAEAQVRAARAGIAVARAAGMPKLSLTAGENYSDPALAGAKRSSSVGVALSVPLFTGFADTYRVRSAEAELDAKSALRDQLSRQVSLDVWRSYYALTTSLESVRASSDLVDSATASENVARGRYKAGAGSILDLLNAQSALAAARQQAIQAAYSWRVAKAALAQAMGQLDFDLIEAGAPTTKKPDPP
jgi:TolC family type I secretion outer membrane protein